MLTANQFHKQSGIQIEFQDFLQNMKKSFGDNFMQKVNEGKVKLEEAQEALGLPTTTTKPEENKISARRNVRSRKVSAKASPKVSAETKSASGLKCTSCESNKNVSGKKGNNTVRNIAIAVGVGALLLWAVKNSK